MKATVGRIWEAASKDDSRPVLTHVSFDAKAGTLTATDSYILARVECEVEDGDESSLIPAAALKQAKGQSLRVSDGKATLQLPDGGERSWPLLDGAFPDADKIFKQYPDGGFGFGVNPELVKCLGVALGAGGSRCLPIALHPLNPLRAIRVTTPSNGGLGLLMPVRLADAPSMKLTLGPDLHNDEAVIAAVRAATFALERKRGKAKAAKAFREVLATAADETAKA
jgi:hypothetical protein